MPSVQSDHPRVLVLGVDCGGTSTRAVIADSEGRVLGLGLSGASNLSESDGQRTAEHIQEAVNSALHHASLKYTQLAAAFVGMAGIGSEAEFAMANSLLDSAGLDTSLVPRGLDHDLRIALAGGLAGDPGICLIAGTGSSCYGRNTDGTSWKAGGWGSLLDDRGSACGLGYAALRAAVRIADGRLPSSCLLTDLMKTWNLTIPRDIVTRVYRQNISKSEIAALAPLVINAWTSGDLLAGQIVRDEIQELISMTKAVIENLQMESATLCCTGGLIEKSSAYRIEVTGRLQSKFPGITTAAPILPPVLGALLLAFKLAKHNLNPSVIARLKESFSNLSRLDCTDKPR
jgi:N-acetylglucosamine kinase-like BadF-type ATPase